MSKIANVTTWKTKTKYLTMKRQETSISNRKVNATTTLQPQLSSCMHLFVLKGQSICLFSDSRKKKQDIGNIFAFAYL